MSRRTHQKIPNVDRPPPTVAIVGPTAAGKSAVAMALASLVNGEIVNADALQLYRGMDIGTAKPSARDRDLVVHHCLDLWEIAERGTLAEFQKHARHALSTVAQAGAVPLVVGGSPLYVRAVVDELAIPPSDPAIRARLEREATELGGPAMHDRLSRLDSSSGNAIDPRNIRRVIRALEVVEIAGSFTARLPAPTSWCPTLWLGVDRPRAELDQRVSERVHTMWDMGLVAEVEQLRACGLATAPTASKAIGYQEILRFLDGELTQTEAQAAMVAATRKLARRQQRNFRQDRRITWLGADPVAQAAERVHAWPASQG